MNKTIEKRQAKEKESLLLQLKKVPIVETACQMVNVSRATFYRWRDKDQEFAKAADAALAEGSHFVNDVAESQLLTAIRNGNLTAIIFWLKNRHNAYKTRVEISNAQKEETTITTEQEEIIKKAIGLTQTVDKKENKNG